MKILNGITVDGARYRPPVERPKWRLVDYFLEAAEQHPGSDVLLWENGEITGWRNDTAKVNIRKNPFRKLRPYKGGLTAAQLLDQAESRRESAALHRFRPTHRRHDLLWARTLRKKAYYTPKRRNKA